MRDDRDAEQQSHRANTEAVRTTGFIWDCNDMFRQAAHLEQEQRKRCTYQTVKGAR